MTVWRWEPAIFWNNKLSSNPSIPYLAGLHGLCWRDGIPLRYSNLGFWFQWYSNECLPRGHKKRIAIGGVQVYDEGAVDHGMQISFISLCRRPDRFLVCSPICPNEEDEILDPSLKMNPPQVLHCNGSCPNPPRSAHSWPIAGMNVHPRVESESPRRLSGCLQRKKQSPKGDVEWMVSVLQKCRFFWFERIIQKHELSSHLGTNATIVTNRSVRTGSKFRTFGVNIRPSKRA
jgi:hypothetical protein